MGILHSVARWYKLTHGSGKRMQADGAAVLACPHCECATPVYQSDYNARGEPVSFTVCLWCKQCIEYNDAVGEPQKPYADTAQQQADRHRSRS